MKCKYSLTFEFEISKPITTTGEAEAGSVRTVLARAADEAIEKHPKMKWSSLVVVLERLDTEKELEEQDLTKK